jgi:hypothetical protein
VIAQHPSIDGLGIDRASFRDVDIVDGYSDRRNGVPATQPSLVARNSDIDAQAVLALDEFNETSINWKVEFGGSICLQAGNRYFYSYPKMSDVPDEVTASTCNLGAVVVGRYHTHGADGMQGPSAKDIANANALTHLYFYVGTPCRSIVSWKGPEAARNQFTLRECRS